MKGRVRRLRSAAASRAAGGARLPCPASQAARRACRALPSVLGHPPGQARPGQFTAQASESPDFQPALEQRAHQVPVPLLLLHQRPRLPQRVAGTPLRHTARGGAGRGRRRRRPSSAPAPSHTSSAAATGGAPAAAASAHLDGAGALPEPLARLLHTVHLSGQDRQALIQVWVGVGPQRLDALEPQVARPAAAPAPAQLRVRLRRHSKEHCIGGGSGTGMRSTPPAQPPAGNPPKSTHTTPPVPTIPPRSPKPSRQRAHLR